MAPKKDASRSSVNEGDDKVHVEGKDSEKEKDRVPPTATKSSESKEKPNKENNLENGEADGENKNLSRKTKGPHQSTSKSPREDITKPDIDDRRTEPLENMEQTGNEPASFRGICDGTVLLLGGGLLLMVVAVLIVPPEPESKTDFDFSKIFENKITDLQSSFTNQTDRFWRILKNRGLAHLRNASPPQPLVLLLAAPPTAHSAVDCLARKLAEVLDPRHKGMLATINGTEEKQLPGEKAKKKMDELLIGRFKAGHRAALVHHLELLPPPSPLLFYSYCDDQNAPNKHVAIIFTVHLPAEPDASLSPREAEGSVEKYLANEVWGKEDKDAVAALLSRVADTVALMNGESGGSATC